MFETGKPVDRKFLLKILPLPLILLVIVVSLAFYFTRPSGQTAPEVLEAVLRQGDSDFEWYKEYFTLNEPKIQMTTNFAGKQAVLFSGTFENLGEKTVDVAEIKLMFFNYEEPVWESVRVPIKPGPYSRPIAPLTGQKFRILVQDLPENWLASHAEMELHGFRFR